MLRNDEEAFDTLLKIVRFLPSRDALVWNRFAHSSVMWR